MLMSARMMFPAARNKSLRSCHPAWYGSYKVTVSLVYKNQRKDVRFRHKADYPGSGLYQSSCVMEVVAEGQSAALAQPLPYQSYREQEWHQTELHFHDPTNHNQRQSKIR